MANCRSASTGRSEGSSRASICSSRIFPAAGWSTSRECSRAWSGPSEPGDHDVGSGSLIDLPRHSGIGRWPRDMAEGARPRGDRRSAADPEADATDRGDEPGGSTLHLPTPRRRATRCAGSASGASQSGCSSRRRTPAGAAGESGGWCTARSSTIAGASRRTSCRSVPTRFVRAC